MSFAIGGDFVWGMVLGASCLPVAALVVSTVVAGFKRLWRRWFPLREASR